MTHPISIIPDIDADQIEALKSLRIRTTEKLLDAASERRGRRLLAERTAINEQQLLRFANIADKLRIKGMGREYAKLLCEAGVDTVRELGFRNARRLAHSMATVNQTRGLVQFLPPENLVMRWVEQARTLPQKISY